MKKKVLIITYYWPPAGGPGVQRVLKFAKYLPELGWEPLILTVKDGDYPAIDFSLEKEIPENIKVYRTKTIEPFSLFKKLSKKDKIDTYVLNNKSDGKLTQIAKFIRANLFIPDARIGWKYFALKKAKEIIKEEQPCIVFSTSPPHSVQLIAKRIAKKHKIKWVSDLRDPWVEGYTNQHLPRTKWAKDKDIKLEKSVLENASFTTLASADFKSIFHSPLSNWKEITNSFEQVLTRTSTKPKSVSIAYAGSMSESQVPHKLIETIASSASQEIELNYYGNVGNEFMKAIEINKLQSKFKQHGYLEKKKLFGELQKNSILLLLMQPYKKGSDNIPLKLFDYLAANRFILAFGNPKGRTAEILEQTETGIVYAYDETFGIKELQTILELQRNFNPDLNTLENYTTKETTKQLVAIFNDLIQ